MEVKTNKISKPFFSICIPQYNRTSFLIESFKVLQRQTFKNFEICVSDGGSTDGRHTEVVEYLLKTEMDFYFLKSEKNLKYDANLRSSISMARGKYCLFMGNDDELANERILEALHQKIEAFNFPSAIVTNFEDWRTGEVTQRVFRDEIVGDGPWTILGKFRNLSFISGLLLDREKCLEYSSERWDGSEMYQMYLFGKIVGAGGKLLELCGSYVRKDMQIQGEQIDSYLKTDWTPSFSQELKLPMLQLAPLNFDAIKEFLSLREQKKAAANLLIQLYLFTYAFWIFQFRKVRSWKYALVFVLACRPSKIRQDMPLSTVGWIQVYFFYSALFVCGLFSPLELFFKFKKQLHLFSKKG